MSSRNARLPTADVFEESRFSSAKLVALIRFVSFWLAVALPIAYLPLLVGGLASWQVPTFLGLFALNVFALVMGHDYGRDSA
jgi:VIT1/CCC1 family predicted Fe2+/Mn2+ transporter